MEITLIKDWLDFLAGDVVSVSEKRAKHLKEIGIAKPDPKPVKSEKPKKKPVKSKEV